MNRRNIKSQFHNSLFVIHNSSKAFSLLELLIYIALLAVIVLVISSAFLLFTGGQAKVETRSEVNSNLRFAIEKISQDIKAASAVITPATAGATSTNLVLTISGSSVTYDVVNSSLRRQLDANPPEIVTTDKVNVSSSTFQRIENINTVLGKTVVSININLTINATGTSPDSQYSASKKTTVAVQ